MYPAIRYVELYPNLFLTGVVAALGIDQYKSVEQILLFLLSYCILCNCVHVFEQVLYKCFYLLVTCSTSLDMTKPNILSLYLLL